MTTCYIQVKVVSIQLRSGMLCRSPIRHPILEIYTLCTRGKNAPINFLDATPGTQKTKKTLLEWKGVILPVFAMKVVVMDTYQHEISSISYIVNFFFESPYIMDSYLARPIPHYRTRFARFHLHFSVMRFVIFFTSSTSQFKISALSTRVWNIFYIHPSVTQWLFTPYKPGIQAQRHQGVQVDPLSGC